MARRVGTSDELTLKMNWIYARVLYRDARPRLTISARPMAIQRSWNGPRGVFSVARTRMQWGLRNPCETREPPSAPAKLRLCEWRTAPPPARYKGTSTPYDGASSLPAKRGRCKWQNATRYKGTWTPYNGASRREKRPSPAT